MHILILHNWLTTGGIERVLISYLGIFSQLGHQTDLLLKYDLDNGCVLYSQIPAAIQVSHFANATETRAIQKQKQKRKSNLKHKLVYEWQRLIWQQRYRLHLADVFRYKQYDCVIDFSDCLDDVVRFPKLLQPNFPPTWRWVHSAISDSVLSAKQQRRFTAVFKSHSRIIAICEAMQQQIRDNLPLPEQQTVCLYNPLDIKAIRTQMTEAVNAKHQTLLRQPFLFQASRLEPRKGLEELIDIYSSLKTQHSIPHKLYIAGEGSLRNRLQQKIQDLGLQQDCLLLGNLDNPYPFFQAASLFVHTSEREGLPTVLLESMACGTPVVAMDCPTGPADILGSNSEYGKLVPLHDQNAFTDAVCELLQNDEIYEFYRQAALDRAEHFSSETVAVQLDALLHNICRCR